MFTRTPAELQTLISNVDQAIYNHNRWYEALIATLMCRLPYDEHDIHEESFRRCRFGQWLYGEGQRLLGDHPSFAAIEGEHRRMHQLAARLLLATAEGHYDRRSGFRAVFQRTEEFASGNYDSEA